MNTAITSSTAPVTTAYSATANASQKISCKPAKTVSLNTAGKNTRRLKLIFEQDVENRDIFTLLGWEDLPEKLKETIRPDLNAYRDELLGLYSTCDHHVLNRRKRVSYWVNAYREGICSEETVLVSLK